MVGELIDEEWWKKNVVKPKNDIDVLIKSRVPRSDPHYDIINLIKEDFEDW